MQSSILTSFLTDALVIAFLFTVAKGTILHYLNTPPYSYILITAWSLLGLLFLLTIILAATRCVIPQERHDINDSK